jgi:hypothetical protein
MARIAEACIKIVAPTKIRTEFPIKNIEEVAEKLEAIGLRDSFEILSMGTLSIRSIVMRPINPFLDSSSRYLFEFDYDDEYYNWDSWPQKLEFLCELVGFDD